MKCLVILTLLLLAGCSSEPRDKRYNYWRKSDPVTQENLYWRIRTFCDNINDEKSMRRSKCMANFGYLYE